MQLWVFGGSLKKKKKRTNLYAVIVLCSLKRDRICFSDLCRRNCDASGCRNFFEFFLNCVTVLVLLFFIVRFQQHNFIWYFFFFFPSKDFKVTFIWLEVKIFICTLVKNQEEGPASAGVDVCAGGAFTALTRVLAYLRFMRKKWCPFVSR